MDTSYANDQANSLSHLGHRLLELIEVSVTIKVQKRGTNAIDLSYSKRIIIESATLCKNIILTNLYNFYTKYSTDTRNVLVRA